MPKPQDIVIHFDDFIKEHKNLLDVLKHPTPSKLKKEYQEQARELEEKTGGLKGVSRASGFVQRAMAEMKKKTGYKKGATDISELNLKDGAKFDPKKISRRTPFISQHLINGVPWEQRRAVPILTTGQTAGVREVDGKVINFKRNDPEYNKRTLFMYPLPREKTRPLTKAEEKARDAYRKSYTKLLKESFPSDFEEKANQPPREVPNVIKRKPGRPPKLSSEMIGKKRKSAPMKIERNPTDIYGLPRRLGILLTEQEGFSPIKGEIAERKYALLSPEERELPENDRAKVAQEKYIAWRRTHNNQAY
jgi:hypothetical protein